MLAAQAMSLCPKAGRDTPQLPASPSSSSPELVGVWVPRRVRDQVTDPAQLADLVVLYSWADKRGHLVAKQSRIMTALGRGSSRPDALGARLQASEAAGWVARERTRLGSGPTRYQLSVLPSPKREPFDVVPHALCRAVAAAAVPANVIRTWLFVDQALGSVGMTTDTTHELAARIGVSVRTLRRQLAVLVEAGALERYGHVLRRPQPAGERMDDDRPVEQPKQIALAEAITPVDNRSVVVVVADTNAGSADTNAGSYYLAPEDLTPETSTPSSRSARHLSERATRATSGRKRPEGGIYSKPGVSEVRDILEADRNWRYGQRKIWQARLLAVVAPHLEAGMSPEAAAHALAVRAEVDIDDSIELGQPPLAAAATGLNALAIDIRLGQACRDCGRDAAEAEQTALIGGRCDWCINDRGEALEREIPTEVLEEVRHHLGATIVPLESSTPEPFAGPAEGHHVVQSQDLGPGQTATAGIASTRDFTKPRSCAATASRPFLPVVAGNSCRHNVGERTDRSSRTWRPSSARASHVSAGDVRRAHGRRLALPP